MSTIAKLIDVFEIEQGDDNYIVTINYDFNVRTTNDGVIKDTVEEIKKEIKDIGKFEKVVNGIRPLLSSLNIMDDEEPKLTKDDIDEPDVRITDNKSGGKSLVIIIRGKEEEKQPGWSPKRKEIEPDDIKEMLRNIPEYNKLKNFVNFLKTGDIL
ncbi:MAG: hypothetical protein DRN17_00255 [Thermoplasmata archaeon]|nr:MAG: hypothetical protein DRN17_00255 [Thermoplasmata archaeon]